MTLVRQSGFLTRPENSANGVVHSISEHEINIEIEPDPGIGTYQWFHFNICADFDASLRIVNAMTSTYSQGWADRVVWSRSTGAQWHPIKTVLKQGAVEFPHLGSAQPISYAVFPPYPLSRLANLQQRARQRGDADIVEDHTSTSIIPRVSLGDRDPHATQIWIIAGQHGGEHSALWFADGFLEHLLDKEEPLIGVRFHIVPIANLNGMKSGYLRANATGQDPNRHWSGDTHCAEIYELVAAMETIGADIILDVHNDFEMGEVYFDVLDAWMYTAEELIQYRLRFETALSTASPDVSFGRRYDWQQPPAPDLLANMCAPALERRFSAVAMTLELPIGRYLNKSGESHIWTPSHSVALAKLAADIIVTGMADSSI